MYNRLLLTIVTLVIFLIYFLCFIYISIYLGVQRGFGYMDELHSGEVWVFSVSITRIVYIAPNR